MHSIHYLFAGLSVAGSLLHAAEPQLLNDGLLSKLRNEAARTHPSAIAGKHQAIAAAHDARAVRLWNDPMIGVGFMGAEEMMRMDDGDVMIGFEQALPKPGMFAAERAKMEAMQRAQIENSGGASLTAGAEAAKAAIELALADESITLQQAQIEWMTAMVENAKQMAADPMGNSTDALRMETELAKEKQMLDAARRSREGYARLLNITLGRPLESPWPVLKLPASPPPVPVATAEVARIPYSNPKVRSMKEMVSAANADTRIADRERLPEVAVGVDAQLYSDTGDIKSTTVGVKISLPWFNDSSYKAKIAAAKSRELAAASDVETMRREIASMVTMAATEAANAAAEARAYSGEIHEKALKATQTTEAAWISSKAPLSDLLDSARTLYSIRLEQRRMIAMQLAALEQLHTLVPNR
ncbi:MAG: TolC family protein [Verrucomicrobiaceae bacterium]|nr:MAG: TolC family protein [Verrucomicrobiaceae bacterium]